MRSKLILLFFLFLMQLGIGMPVTNIISQEKSDTIIPSYINDYGNGFSIEIKLNIALGTHGRGLGVNAITSYTGSSGSVSAGIGSTYYLSEIGTGKSVYKWRIQPKIRKSDYVI